jgi:hypothetical protein
MKSFILNLHELFENKASIARIVFMGALELFKIEIAFEHNTEGKAFLRSTKHKKYGLSCK